MYGAPPPAAGSDFSWVKPGKVVWDYWADWNLEGVDFKAGRNTATFLHYVDFAARHGFCCRTNEQRIIHRLLAECSRQRGRVELGGS